MAAQTPVVLTDISLFQVGDNTYDYIDRVTIKFNTRQMKTLRSNGKPYPSSIERTYVDKGKPVIELGVYTEDQGNVLTLAGLDPADVIVKGLVFGGSGSEATLTITDALFGDPSQTLQGAGNSDSDANITGWAVSSDGTSVPYTFVTA